MPKRKNLFLKASLATGILSALIVSGLLWGAGPFLHFTWQEILHGSWVQPSSLWGERFLTKLPWILILPLALGQALRWRRKRALRQLLAGSIPSDRRKDYVFAKDDYRRGNHKEQFYRKAFVLTLLETFGNCCAKCQSQDQGLDIDHFLFSKNEGGSFIMKHRSGVLVNNAIPLCQSCNRRKSDRNYMEFFSEQELAGILPRNHEMTKRLNEKMASSPWWPRTFSRKEGRGQTSAL